jgi:hypothetical protein
MFAGPWMYEVVALDEKHGRAGERRQRGERRACGSATDDKEVDGPGFHYRLSARSALSRGIGPTRLDGRN